MVKWYRVAFPDANALRGIWGHPPNFGVEQTEPLLGLAGSSKKEKSF